MQASISARGPSASLGPARPQRRPLRPQAFFKWPFGGAGATQATPNIKRLELQQELISTVDGTKYGASADAQSRESAELLIAALANAAPKPGPTSLDGIWNLQYTTEKSVHSIVRSLPVQRIRQTIDLESSRVTNQIYFNLLGMRLEASAPATQVSNSRIEYAFDSFYLVLGGSLRLDLSAIVRGGGWTEACYLSEDMRIMNNSQGDTLVFVRADDE